MRLKDGEVEASQLYVKSLQHRGCEGSVLARILRQLSQFGIGACRKSVLSSKAVQSLLRGWGWLDQAGAKGFFLRLFILITRTNRLEHLDELAQLRGGSKTGDSWPVKDA